MSQIVREYEYRPPWGLLFTGCVFCGVGAAVLGLKASTNVRGVNINGILELSDQQATVFYWVLCAAAVGFVVIVIWLALHWLMCKQRVALTDTTIIVPRSRWSAREQEISYDQILEISSTEMYGNKWLKVAHTAGSFTIIGTLLRDEEFQELCAYLRKRVAYKSTKASGIDRYSW